LSESKTSERRLAAHERQLYALELRREGKSFPQIARELGYRSVAGAYDAVMGALRETLREPAEQVRALELERLDQMLDAIWPTALTGSIPAQAQVLRLMERRAKYLGLDAPARVDVEQRIRGVAAQLGLDPDAAVAEAQRILKENPRVAMG
jgi:hypothetical protein